MEEKKKLDKKEVNSFTKRFSKVLLLLCTFSSILLLFLFGFVYISTNSNNPYVAMLIDLNDESVAQKVKPDFPIREDIDLKYRFDITVETIKENGDSYLLTGVPTNYEEFFTNRDEARFTYELKKDLGEFNFKTLSWNEEVVLSLRYRVQEDVSYFVDFALCSIKRAYSDMFNIYNSCSRGNCIISRDLVKWDIHTVNSSLSEVVSLESIDTDKMFTRSLVNYFITDDAGYLLTDNTFKLRSIQRAETDDTFKYKTTFSSLGMADSSYPYWFISGMSLIYDREYSEYKDIDMISYMHKVATDFKQQEIKQVYFDCQSAYAVVENLKGCESLECAEIKQSAFEQCSKVMEYITQNYDSAHREYAGYDYIQSANAYLLYFPTEMMYYNKIIQALRLEKEQYTKNEITQYYALANELVQQYPSVVSSCHMLKNSEEISLEYGDSTYSSYAQEIFNSLPDFSKICTETVKDTYCLYSIAKRVVCADALAYNHINQSEVVLKDLYVRHSSSSYTAPKMSTYPDYREHLREIGNYKGVHLDNYGYLIMKRETLLNEDDVQGLNMIPGTLIVTSADMIDSFYYINILNRVNNAKK